MSQRTTKLLKAALSALHYSGADAVIKPYTRGSGVIFMLHHVRPEPPQPFEPNRILTITPDFLDDVIGQVLDAGFDVLALDDVPARVAANASARPFACFTFDDGYRDNRQYAYPIFKKHNLPFAIYVPSDFPDGDGDLWWLVLEQVIRRAPDVTVQMNGALEQFATRTVAEKEDAFAQIYWWLRSIPEDRARAVVAELASSVGYDAAGLCHHLVMGWDELRALAADPLVTIGAHTRRHMALAKLSEADAEAEMREGIARIEREIGQPCLHFSYPYGCERSAGSREFRMAKELGMRTAVTTQKGLIHASHVDAMMALPRFSLNGDFQRSHYVKVMLTGAPFALWGALQRMTT